MKIERRSQFAWSLALPAILGVLITLRVAPALPTERIGDSASFERTKLPSTPTVLPRPAVTPSSLTLPEMRVPVPLPSLMDAHALLPVDAGAPLGTTDRSSSDELTPIPEDPRLVAAKQRLAEGDVASALSQLRQVSGDPNPVVAARARFVLAQSLLTTGDDAQAQQVFQQYLSQYPSGPDAPRAAFALGEIELRKGNTGSAASYLQMYLARTSDHALDGYVESALAQIAQANGDPAAAIVHWRRAVEAGVPLSQEIKVASIVGAALQQSGQPDEAASWYGTLAARPSNDRSTRAHYQFLQASALERTGKTADAVALYRQLVDDGSAGIDTGAAIAALRSLGQPVSDFAAGEAYLKARQYDQAVAALGDYLDRNPNGPDAASARYDRGRALLGQNNFAAAAAQLDRFVSLYPNDPRLGSAALLEGQALQRAGNTSQAVAFLETFANQHPSDPNAPQALWNAIQYLEQSSPGSALRLEKELMESYPRSPLAAAAAFDVGWASYENLDFAAAKATFQTVRDRWPDSPLSAPALLWLGKMEQRAGNIDEANRDFELAWNANPGDYYAFRALELAGRSSKPSDTSLAPPPSDAELNRERVAFEIWLATWTHPDQSTVGQPYLGAPISRGGALGRIRELAQIGLQDDLANEIKQAMSQYADDGRSLYALADVLSQAGLTSQSMAAAYRLLLISPAPNSYQSPVFLQRLVYPFPFHDLIVQSSRKYGVDPLLLVSLIRQESAFDTKARSSANALGLTQFMPSTAIDVATSIGISDFDLTDLYRPSVAIPLGAAYLASQTKAFGGNPYFALAAYNAGGGNVARWLSDNPRRDLDLLVEEIPFKQTYDYVRNIYRFYQEYKFLYRTPAGG